MSSQLLSDGQSAACSQSTASSSSFSSTSSPSPSDCCGSSGSDNEPHSTSKSRRGRRGGRGRGRSDRAGTEEVKKMMKNAREKERVRLVREEYMELSAVLGDRVERGSGHFSKVSTLEAAIRCIEDLMKVRSQLVSDEALSCPSTPQDVQLESRCEDSTDASSPDITPGINLNCDERLEPPEVHDLDNLPCPALDMSTVPPVYPAATPYFGYSSPGDFPPVTGNSSCMFPFPGSSPCLPPPSSFLCSPDLAGHTPLPTVPMTENLSPLSTSPPQHPYQCGTDVWLAIGCN